MRKLKGSVLPVFMVLMLLVLSLRFVWFSIYISSKKSEFRHQVLLHQRAEIKRLKIPLHQLYRNSPGFTWKESGRELVIGEVYHEVIAVKTGANTVELYLIEDKAENRLFSEYFKLRQAQQNDGDSFFFMQGLVYLNGKKLKQIPATCLSLSFKTSPPVLSSGHCRAEHRPPCYKSISIQAC